ncbi:MAG: HAD domain-containing protein [Methyloversatilis sp.]|uniref:HAD domain-containing protein n=1 Tax=Methyloversatilis sp. TaxID=2569862 RepID=UPI0025F00C88|nr:HAD domain-containing protein [Methyloversatilis sp.]MCR6665755.1 HAD domain-containing protein [Methyloversatilis sp.]
MGECITVVTGIRQREPKLPTLFLDFDGVLHPDEVYRVGERIVLRMDGFSLFEWSEVLDELMEPYPALQIVLSTTWVRLLGFEVARSHLPESLQRRVVGATWHETAPRGWERLTRYEQIQLNVVQHRHARWLAIDDDGHGWSDEHRSNLVLTDSLLGLGAASAQDELRDKLALLCH